MSELRDAILELAEQYNWDHVDIATIFSYETGGTFDPWKRGPTTQWGEHRGLIQWGVPQRQKYGVTRDMSVRDQVFAAGRYFLDHGVKPGDGILPLYASINGGHASKIHASDAHNGGAPGTVLDKVNYQMSGHRKNAVALFAGSFVPKSSVNHSFNDSTVEVPMAPQPFDYSQTEKEDVGLVQLQSDAFNTEQNLAWMLRGSPDYAPDPNFNLTPERIKEDLGKINADVERYAGWLSDAVSEKAYGEILGNIEEDRNRLQRLSDAGLTGTILRIANSILDPVAITAEAVALAALPPAGASILATRLGRIVNATMRGAAAGFAGEASALPFNPHRTQTDLLAGTVLGAGVGTVVGSLQKGTATADEAIRLQRTARGLVDELEAEGLPNLNDSVGAARVNRPDQYLDEDAAEFLEDKDIAETFGSTFRLDLSAMLDKSKNPMVRVLGGLVQDGTGKKGGAINHIAPSEERMLMREEYTTAVHRTYNPAWKEYLKELDIPIHKQGERARAEAKFNEEIYDYITDRTTGRTEAYHPAVVRTGNKIASLFSELLQLAQNPFLRDGGVGRPVKGFEDVKEDVHYMTRMWDERRVVLANDEYVNGTIEQLIEGAMRKANADIDPDLLKRLSKKFTKSLLRRSQGVEELMMRRLGPESVDDLVKELELNSNDAANLKSWFEARTSKDAGRDARAKRRTLLAEDFAISNPRRRDGTVDDQGLSIKDLLKRNGLENFSRAVDRMAGMIALARYRWKDPVTGELLVDGITSDSEWESLKDIARKKAADAEPSKRQSPGEIAADLERLDLAYSSIRGRPLSEAENTKFGMWARLIRKYNYSNIMNQVGFAQISELGVTIGHLGVKASFSQVPALRRMINEDGETILKSGLADDLEVWLGVGTDRLRHQSDMRYDDLSGIHEEATGTWRDKADYVLNKANQVTSEISGMTQINTMLQRWTSASIVQRFADIARKDGKGLSDARWADLGIDGEMKDRIIKMINTEGNLEFTKGWITNNKVSRIHPSKWTDREAAEAFRKGVYRLSNQLIQKNDIGNLMEWMHHPAAKLLMQFRTFMVGAWVKQTMKSLNFRDREALASALLGMAAAGAAYVAQTKIKGIGRTDQDSYYEKNLSWEKIGTAAFARSGVSTIFPMLVDTARHVLGNDAMFSHTRTTGQVSHMLFGNPTVSGVDNIFQSGRSVAGLFDDREWSAQEVRNIQRIMPFGNAIFLVPIIESLINAGDMPKYAPRN